MDARIVKGRGGAGLVVTEETLGEEKGNESNFYVDIREYLLSREREREEKERERVRKEERRSVEEREREEERRSVKERERGDRKSER